MLKGCSYYRCCPNAKREIGRFTYDYPLFWIYYPHTRSILAKYLANDPISRQSWLDVIDSRNFSSYIAKEDNKYDRKIDSYISNPRDRHIQGQRISDNSLIKNKIYGLIK